MCVGAVPAGGPLWNVVLCKSRIYPLYSIKEHFMNFSNEECHEMLFFYKIFAYYFC